MSISSRLKAVAKSVGDFGIEALAVIAGVASLVVDLEPPEQRNRRTAGKRPSPKQVPIRPPKKRADAKWWKVLEIPQTASVTEIKAAYRRLICLTHPDKVASLSASLRKVAERDAKRLNAAYAEALAIHGAHGE